LWWIPLVVLSGVKVESVHFSHAFTTVLFTDHQSLSQATAVEPEWGEAAVPD